MNTNHKEIFLKTTNTDFDHFATKRRIDSKKNIFFDNEFNQDDPRRKREIDYHQKNMKMNHQDDDFDESAEDSYGNLSGTENKILAGRKQIKSKKGRIHRNHDFIHNSNFDVKVFKKRNEMGKQPIYSKTEEIKSKISVLIEKNNITLDSEIKTKILNLLSKIFTLPCVYGRLHDDSERDVVFRMGDGSDIVSNLFATEVALQIHQVDEYYINSLNLYKAEQDETLLKIEIDNIFFFSFSYWKVLDTFNFIRDSWFDFTGNGKLVLICSNSEIKNDEFKLYDSTPVVERLDIFFQKAEKSKFNESIKEILMKIFSLDEITKIKSSYFNILDKKSNHFFLKKSDFNDIFKIGGIEFNDFLQIEDFGKLFIELEKNKDEIVGFKKIAISYQSIFQKIAKITCHSNDSKIVPLFFNGIDKIAFRFLSDISKCCPYNFQEILLFSEKLSSIKKSDHTLGIYLEKHETSFNNEEERKLI